MANLMSIRKAVSLADEVSLQVRDLWLEGFTEKINFEFRVKE